jgi:hypothetical protein
MGFASLYPSYELLDIRMHYMKVRFKRDESPVIESYHELDDMRWEFRKVEIFRTGKVGYADTSTSKGTGLSITRIPPLSEILSDPQFEPCEITKNEFEAIWARVGA